jgi:hypothetical protein
MLNVVKRLVVKFTGLQQMYRFKEDHHAGCAGSPGEIRLCSRGTVCLPVQRISQTSNRQEADRKQSCLRLVSCFA